MVADINPISSANDVLQYGHAIVRKHVVISQTSLRCEARVTYNREGIRSLQEAGLSPHSYIPLARSFALEDLKPICLVLESPQSKTRHQKPTPRFRKYGKHDFEQKHKPRLGCDQNMTTKSSKTSTIKS
jgi:hypothetical protein